MCMGCPGKTLQMVQKQDGLLPKEHQTHGETRWWQHRVLEL